MGLGRVHEFWCNIVECCLFVISLSFGISLGPLSVSAGLVACLAAGSLVAASPAGEVAGYGDIAEGRYYTEPVQWSVDNDVTGIGGDCFLPDAPVSRGEAAVTSGTWRASRLRPRIPLLT